jgi:hypothetical protein
MSRRRPKSDYGLHPSIRKHWAHGGSVSVRLVVGLLIVVLGVLSLISNLHIFEMYSPMRYFWAAACMAIGFALVIEHRTERSWQWGIAWIAVGLWHFAYKRGWIDVSVWELFIPFLMLAGGAYLVRRSLTEGDEAASSEGNTLTNKSGNTFEGNTVEGQSAPKPDKVVRGIGVLSGSELKPTAHAMRRAELVAFMGGVKLDLYDTQLVNDAATIDVAAIMGGVEIHVPSEWTIVSNVLPLMGAFIDKRRPAATPVAGAPTKTLTIDGFVLMGGIEVKN